MIGDTIIGKTANYFAREGSMFEKFIWSGASELFCQQSAGNAYAFVSNGTFDVSTSIFWNYEMPILLSKVRDMTQIIIEIF